jgi:hypothetical protein
MGPDIDSRGGDPYTHGNSFANGPQDGPLRRWEMRLLTEAQTTFYGLV